MSARAGDAADLDVMHALPDGSIVTAHDGTIAQRLSRDVWLLPGDERLFPPDELAPRHLTVLRVGWKTTPTQTATTERAT